MLVASNREVHTGKGIARTIASAAAAATTTTTTATTRPVASREGLDEAVIAGLSLIFGANFPLQISTKVLGVSQHPATTKVCPNQLETKSSDGFGGEGLHWFPEESPDSAVIFLHGLKGSAHGWKHLPTELNQRSPAFARTMFVLPSAPTRAISMMQKFGVKWPAWADVFTIARDTKEDMEGFEKSRARIDDIIAKLIEQHKIPPHRIFVGGFSQGAALAYHVGLRSKVKLGGVVALSGWVPLAKDYESLEPSDVPIIHCHGTADNVIKFEWGRESADLLSNLNLSNLTFHELPGVKHTMTSEAFSSMSLFVERLLF